MHQLTAINDLPVYRILRVPNIKPNHPVQTSPATATSRSQSTHQSPHEKRENTYLPNSRNLVLPILVVHVYRETRGREFPYTAAENQHARKKKTSSTDARSVDRKAGKERGDEQLPTHPTRTGAGFYVCRDCDRFEGFVALHLPSSSSSVNKLTCISYFVTKKGEGEGTDKRIPKRDSLRAHAYGVRGILNICAEDVLAACRDEACAHAEFAVGAFSPSESPRC